MAGMGGTGAGYTSQVSKDLRLDDDGRVERLGGLLSPPMLGVWKRIRSDRGET